MKKFIAHLAASLWMSAVLGCAPSSTDMKASPSDRSPGAAAAKSPAVAWVNGHPIDAASVKRLLEEAPSVDAPEAALDILIENRLLADEATRRGYNRSSAVKIARRSAAARALLKRETEVELTAQSLPMTDVQAYYESHKKKFVHSEKRNVVHFLARTGKKRFSDTEALRLAETAAQAARGATDSGDFKSRMKPFVEEYKKKTVLESLPPFEADDRRLVRPFVEATFQLKGERAISPPIKTDFGYHIIFVAGTTPPLNRSFQDAETEIRETMLPKARKKRAAQFIASLREKREVFVYEEALKEGVPSSE